jgi:hypothetical protein
MRGVRLNSYIPEVEGEIGNKRNNEKLLQFIIMDLKSASNTFTNFLPEKLDTVTEIM